MSDRVGCAAGTTFVNQTIESPSTCLISTRAFAKINLTLDVLGRRPDGYHALRSLVIGVDLSDRVACRAAAGGIRLICDDPSLPTDENLVVRAARALADDCGVEAAVEIVLQKTVPRGAGLGGGSSDAAASLRVCNELWNLGLDRDALARIGAKVGSDVSLFFYLPSAIITGRGEVVTPAPMLWHGFVVLVFTGEFVSTPEVFAAWRPSDCAGSLENPNADIAASSTSRDISEMLFNRLEPAVFRVCPSVAEAHHTLSQLGMGPVRVSGAGSVLFMLFDEVESARVAAARIEKRLIGAEVSVVRAPVEEAPIVCEEN